MRKIALTSGLTALFIAVLTLPQLQAQDAATQPATQPATAPAADAAAPAAGLEMSEADVIKRVSYAFGLQIGGQLAASPEMQLDFDQFVDGVKTAFEEGEPKYSQQELQVAFERFQGIMMEKAMAASKTNAAEGAAYLEKNAKKDGVKVTESGLQYEVVREGKGKKPAADATVRVHYEGKLLSGDVFDSSYQRGEPVEFPVEGVIQGWTEALKMMPVGSKWKLTIPSNLAYGERGNRGIPPNAVLVFDVELLDIVE